MTQPISLRPLNNRVLVQRDAMATSKGGLYIPDIATENALSGTVIAVGPGRRSESGNRIPTELVAGDKVQFGKYAGNDIQLNGEPFLLLMEDEILGKVHD